ncbi:hypothetical protein P7C73_g6524, partial [Tremellales sp. Uapishka_1]
MSQAPLTPFGSALAGAMGAPRLPPRHRQDASSGAPSVLRPDFTPSAPQALLQTEGIVGTFKGYSANMINTFSMQFAYFFFHSLLRTSYLRRRASVSKSLSTSAELLLGAIAGAFAQIFTIPVSVIATRQQLHLPSASKPASASPSLLQTANEIIDEGGITALWTGLKPGLVLTVNPAITYGVFERLKSWTLRDRPVQKLTVAEAFWIGVGSKTLATVVTYPYIFAKVRLQAKPALEKQPAASYAEAAAEPAGFSPSKSTPKGAIGLLHSVYEERGLSGWYQGMGAQIVKAVLCQGILFVSKDQFEIYAYVLLASLARVRKRVAQA